MPDDNSWMDNPGAVEPLRLHLDEIPGIPLFTDDRLYLTTEEIRALYNWMKYEFIPHNEDYEMISNVLKKFDDKLAR